MNHAKHASMMLAHRSYNHGSDNVMDSDLVQLAEAYPDLRPVFEEVQFLRRENAALEEDIQATREDAERWREEAQDF